MILTKAKTGLLMWVDEDKVFSVVTSEKGGCTLLMDTVHLASHVVTVTEDLWEVLEAMGEYDPDDTNNTPEKAPEEISEEAPVNPADNLETDPTRLAHGAGQTVKRIR